MLGEGIKHSIILGKCPSLLVENCTLRTALTCIVLLANELCTYDCAKVHLVRVVQAWGKACASF